MAMKSSLVLFRSLAASPMKSCCCCSRFLSSSSKEKSPAYHRGEDDEPSIRSRLPPREKVWKYTCKSKLNCNIVILILVHCLAHA
ncbi:hypothetical protein MKW94_008925 [Papaver nudicaule]|uniref:Uncharacterized protein n=1 Tax=Papaver nudicaule TaxID=74823 RepID=A0AA41RV54_PAPNU|nr:hypothetical protein [Papaver nudicaule]